jgi:hypothetical protein
MPDIPIPTNDEVKEVIAAVNTGKDFPGEFRLGDGTVVKASNWEEAFQRVAEMKSNTAAALRDREEQIRRQDDRIRELNELHNAVVTNRPVPDAGNASGFDEKTYWSLMNTSPINAQNYLDAFRMGVDRPEQVPLLFNEMRNVSVYSADNMEMQSFMQRNPDWPGTDQGADLIIERLAQKNAPLTADNLEYEYLKAVRNGEIEPLQDEAERPFVPPNIGSGASLSRDDVNVMEQIRNTPDDKLDEVYRRLGLLK